MYRFDRVQTRNRRLASSVFSGETGLVSFKDSNERIGRLHVFRDRCNCNEGNGQIHNNGGLINSSSAMYILRITISVNNFKQPSFLSALIYSVSVTLNDRAFNDDSSSLYIAFRRNAGHCGGNGAKLSLSAFACSHITRRRLTIHIPRRFIKNC